MTARRRHLLVVRADGGPGIGHGHVLRSLALAEAWSRRGGESVLVSAALPDRLRARVAAGNVAVRSTASPLDPDEFAGVVAALAPSWVALDGYRFDRRYQRAAAGGGARVAVVDDHGSIRAYRADLLVDQNLGADAAAYRDRPTGCSLLLGPRYALLREELVVAARNARRAPRAEVERLLVTLGGAPPADAVATVAEAVRLAGADDRATFAGGDRPVDDMAELMAAADLAVSAAGTTVWELAALGVPMLLVPVADNQDRVAAQLAAHGMARSMSRGASAEAIASALHGLMTDGAARRRLADAASTTVDGNGARRVVTAMKARLLDLRPAEPADCSLLWRWVNDPAVRASAFDERPIPYPRHETWFSERLASADCRIRIGRDGDDDIGQVRLERDPATGDATVDVSVAAERRGEGWAAALIDRASADVLASGWCSAVHAWVKRGNHASRAAFLEAGFEHVEDATPGRADALHYARMPTP